jgi:thioredoxin-like negative regulator of GroEL
MGENREEIHREEIHYVTNETLDHILNSDLPIIIDFYSDWCPACSQMKPIFENLAIKFGDICLFAKVRTDEDVELSQAFEIDAIPCFVFMHKKQIYGKLRGSIGFSALEEAIRKIVEIVKSKNEI